MADALSLAAMIATDNAASDKATDATPEPVAEPETPVDAATETAVETDAGEKTEAAESELTIRGYAKELLGNKPWLEKYKDDDELLRGVDEAISMLGQRDTAGETVKWMVEHNITPDDLQRIIQDRASGPKDSKTPEWDESWVSVNDKGEWQPTSEAPPDFAVKAAKYRAQLAKAMASPKKLAEFLRPHLQGDIDKATTATKQEVSYTMAQERAARETTEWATAKKALLYTNEVGGDFTPLGKEVNSLLSEEGFYPQLAWTERAERALKFANGQMKSATAPVKAVPNKAKHQVPVATGTTSQSMSDDEFRTKYGGSLRDFARFVETGKTPDQK